MGFHFEPDRHNAGAQKQDSISFLIHFVLGNKDEALDYETVGDIV